MKKEKRASIIRGRFDKEVNRLAQSFSASHEVDRKLYPFDIAGSKVHARMLQRQGLLSKKELGVIQNGLETIRREIEEGRMAFSDSMEDIHMHIESRLIELTGETGKKLHTGRSRNDQVALDFRLYCRYSIFEIVGLLEDFMHTLLEKAKEHEEVFMPAYTHLQQAQIIRAAHHFLAHLNMAARDRERMLDTYKRVIRLPLGAGALAGTGLGNDRQYICEELCFDQVIDNSLDAVSDRDFALEFLFNISLVGLHLSRYAEEIVLWFTAEFDFIELDESYCTGSSLMPQKSNPDIAELVRGKTGRFLGNFVNLYTTLKGLPLAYNRDLQEDKQALFDSVDSIKQTLSVFTGMISTLKIKKDLMERQQNDYMLATDVAEFLVLKGLPFREAHEATGKLVRHAIGKKSRLKDLSLEEFRLFSSCFDSSIYSRLELKKSPDQKNTYGSTSLKEIKRQIRDWGKFFKELKNMEEA